MADAGLQGTPHMEPDGHVEAFLQTKIAGLETKCRRLTNERIDLQNKLRDVRLDASITGEKLEDEQKARELQASELRSVQDEQHKMKQELEPLKSRLHDVSQLMEAMTMTADSRRGELSTSEEKIAHQQREVDHLRKDNAKKREDVARMRSQRDEDMRIVKQIQTELDDMSSQLEQNDISLAAEKKQREALQHDYDEMEQQCQSQREQLRDTHGAEELRGKIQVLTQEMKLSQEEATQAQQELSALYERMSEEERENRLLTDKQLEFQQEISSLEEKLVEETSGKAELEQKIRLSNEDLNETKAQLHLAQKERSGEVALQRKYKEKKLEVNGKFSVMEAECAQLKVHAAALTEEIAEKQEKIADLQEAHNHLQNESQVLGRQLAEQSETFQAGRQRADDQMKDKLAIIKSTEHQLINQESKTATMAAELAELIQTHEQMNRANDNLQKKFKTQELNMREKERGVRERSLEIGKCRVELNKTKQEAESYKHRLSESDIAQRNLTEHAVAKTEAILEHDETILKLKNAINQNNTDIDVANSACAEAQQLLKAKERDIRRLEDIETAMREKVKELQDQVRVITTREAKYEQEKEEKCQEVTVLTLELSRIKEKFACQEEDFSIQKRRMKNLQDQLVELTDEKETAMCQVRSGEKYTTEQAQCYADVLGEVTRLKQKEQDIRGELDDEIRMKLRAEKKRQDLEKRVGELELEVGDCKTRLHDEEDKNANLQAEFVQITGELSKVHRCNDNAALKSDQLVQQLTHTENELQKIDAKCQELLKKEAEHLNQKRKLELLQTEKAEVAKKLVDLQTTTETENENLQKTIAHLSGLVTQLRSEVDHWQNTARTLPETFRHQTTEIERLKNEIDDLKYRVSQMQQQNTGLRHEIKTLESEISHLNEAAEKTEQTLTDTWKKKHELAHDNFLDKAAIDRLNVKLVQSTGEMEKVKAERDWKKKMLTTQQSRNEKLREQLEQERRDVPEQPEYEQELSDVQSKLCEAERKQKTVEFDYQVASARLEVANSTVQRLCREKHDTGKQLAMEREISKDFKIKLECAATRTEALMDTCSKLEKDHVELRQEVHNTSVKHQHELKEKKMQAENETRNQSMQSQTKWNKLSVQMERHKREAEQAKRIEALYKGHAEELMTQVDDLKKQVDNDEDITGEQRMEVNQLKVALKHSNAQLNQLKRKYQLQEEDIQKKDHDINSLTGHYNQQTIAIADEQDKYRKELINKIADISAEKDNCEKKLSKLQENYAQMQEDLGNLHRSHVKLQEDHTKIHEDHEKLQGDHGKLQEDHEKLQKDRGKLQEDHKKLQEDHDKLLEDRGKLQENHGKLQEDHEKLQGDHGKLQEDRGKLQEDHMKLQEDHRKLQEDHGKLQEYHEKLQEDNKKLQEDHKKLHEDHGKLQEDHGKLQEDHDKLQEDHGKLHEDHGKLQEDHEKQHEDHKKLLEDHDKLQEDHNKLQEDHKKLQENHDTLQEDHEKLQEDHKKLQDNHDTLLEDRGKLHEDHEKLQEDRGKLQEDHVKLQEDHDKLQGNNGKLQEDHEKLQEDHKKLHEDHEKLQGEQSKKDFAETRITQGSACGGGEVSAIEPWQFVIMPPDDQSASILAGLQQQMQSKSQFVIVFPSEFRADAFAKVCIEEVLRDISLPEFPLQIAYPKHDGKQQDEGRYIIPLFSRDRDTGIISPAITRARMQNTYAVVVMFHRVRDWGDVASSTPKNTFSNFLPWNTPKPYCDKLHPTIYIQLDPGTHILDHSANREAMDSLRELLMEKTFFTYNQACRIRKPRDRSTPV